MDIHTISIIGGTGKEGKGLAYRWGKAGYTVLIGSRQAEKAEGVAAEVNTLLKHNDKVIGCSNEEAAAKGDVIVLTVPYSAHQDMIKQLANMMAGKILIDVTVPIVPPKVTKVQMPPAGSALMETKKILEDTVQIASAFQNISYERLISEKDIECDVLVCGDKIAREATLTLVKNAGLTGWDAGPVENSVVVEGMTSILLGINKQFGVQSAGIKIIGVKRD